MTPNPWFVFEVAIACNTDCVWCATPQRPARDPSLRDMHLQDVEKLLTRLKKDADPAGITLSGGEPLLRTDLAEIAACCRQLSIPVTVATNGILLDQALLNKLLEAGVSGFELSLPSTDPLAYQLLTGRDQLRTVRKTLAELGAARVPFLVSTVITAQNTTAPGGVIELATAFGARAVNLHRCLPEERRPAGPERLLPEQEELAAALDDAEAAARSTGLPVSCTIPVEPCLFPLKRWPSIAFSPCHCGESVWAIGADGTFRTCQHSPDPLGRNYRQVIALPEVSRFRNNNRFPACAECASLSVCGGGCRFL